MCRLLAARRIPGAALGAISMLCAAMNLHAGRLLVAQEERAGDTRLRGSRYELSSDGLRMSGVRGSALSTVIYRKADERFFLIDDKAKSYREVGREQIVAALIKAREALAALEKQASKIKSDDRESIQTLLTAGRKYLNEALGGHERPLSYRQIEGEFEQMGLRCIRYEKRVGDEVVGEVWTVPAEALGLSAGELAVLDDVGGLFESAVSSITGIKETSSFLPRPQPSLYEGVPVRRVRLKAGLVAADWKLISSEPAEYPPEHFSPPPDFKKKGLLE